jgi:hypothetical protein
VDVLSGCLATESTMLVVCGRVVGRESTGEAEGYILGGSDSPAHPVAVIDCSAPASASVLPSVTCAVSC